MTSIQPGSFESTWGEYGAEEWSDALMASMKLGGIDNLFFVSGSEIAFYQESAAKAREREWPSPRLVTMTHEGAALHAALGNAMVSGQPAATAVHVDVGTLNYGAAIHTAWRGGYPVLITAGTGPRAYPGTMRGGRDAGIQWVQEPRDQGEILRQYTKHDHRLEHMDNPGLMVSRLLQVAMSDPQGPVYMTVPREVAMQPMPGSTRFPTRDQLGIARPAWPDPRDAKTAAEWLVKANNPVICLAKSGRHPGSVEALVRLAELLGLPVRETQTDKINFPNTHPLYGTGPDVKDADVVLVAESPAPFTPGRNAPERRREGHLGRPGPSPVSVQDDGVPRRHVAARERHRRSGGHLRGRDGHAHQERHGPHRRPSRPARSSERPRSTSGTRISPPRPPSALRCTPGG